MKDYSLWSTLYQGEISDDGKWASFTVKSHDGNDTLFVSKTDAKRIYKFPKGNSGSFSERDNFACRSKSQLSICNLSQNRIRTIDSVTHYQWIKGNFIVYSNKQNGEELLTVEDNAGKVIWKQKNVIDWALSPDKTGIAYATEENKIFSAGVIDIRSIKIDWALRNTSTEYAKVHWADNTFIIWISESQINSRENLIFCYNTKTKGMSFLNNNALPSQYKISENPEYLSITNDGRYLFFGLMPTERYFAQSNDVQVWNAADKWSYPQKVAINDWKNNDMIGRWDLYNGTVTMINDTSKPKLMLEGSGEFAIRWNPQAYEPQFRFHGPVDYEIIDLNNGISKPLLATAPGNDGYLLLSPDRQNVVYFENGNWQCYNFNTGMVQCLSESIPGNLFDDEDDRPDLPPPYGVAGWSSNGQYFIFYDRFDIWRVKIDGTDMHRLTRGREAGITYRFTHSVFAIKYDGNIMPEINLNEPNLLHMENTEGFTGYCLLNNNRTLNKVFGPKQFDSAKKARSGKAFTYIRQDYNEPPSLVFCNDSGKKTLLYQSNKQHYHYKWGTSQLITYRIKSGKELKGILYAPPNIESGEKYPMIIEIYQKQSPTLHHYINPEISNMKGFNISNYTTQGYFVLKPDIRYDIGHVGRSALECTISAADAAIAKFPINELRIGLIGHSQGGYEVNFIITQSDRFATAVSGAGIADLTSSYFGMGWNYEMTDSWRYEYESFRIGKTFYEAKDSYFANSPVLHAESLKTPLLAWAGTSDRQVDYYQSLEFYNALRRLRKKHILLLYPGEGHVLMKKKSQQDLTLRIEEWFGYYLKDEKDKPWMFPDYLHE
nr:prolyl oligopeptidase family serine peptidase [uncultured Flavobacterium sp.]